MSGPPSPGVVRVAALAAMLLAATALVVPAVGAGSQPERGDGVHPEGPFVAVGGNGTAELWPYTSRSRAPSGATLPINVVVEQHPSFVRYVLTRDAEAEWNVSDTGHVVLLPENEPDNGSSREGTGLVIDEGGVTWTGARGSDRYTYVRAAGTGEGRWLEETYQLHDGTYFGSRYHVRVYGFGSDGHALTAVQAHREHWDWFQLRHTVDSVGRAQTHLETTFRSAGLGFSIRRTWYDNGGALDSHGWVTTVDRQLDTGPALAIPWFLLIGGAVALASSTTIDRGEIQSALRNLLDGEAGDVRYLALLTSLPLLVLGVRVAAIAVEGSAGWLSPWVIAAGFYPVLALGVPACAVFLSRSLDPTWSGGVAAAGLGTGIVADYAYVQVAALPIDVVVHRAVLLAAIAALAAGGASVDASWTDARYRNPVLLVGALGWLLALAVPLLDLL